MQGEECYGKEGVQSVLQTELLGGLTDDYVFESLSIFLVVSVRVIKTYCLSLETFLHLFLQTMVRHSSAVTAAGGCYSSVAKFIHLYIFKHQAGLIPAAISPCPCSPVQCMCAE